MKSHDSFVILKEGATSTFISQAVNIYLIQLFKVFRVSVASLDRSHKIRLLSISKFLFIVVIVISILLKPTF